MLSQTQREEMSYFFHQFLLQEKVTLAKLTEDAYEIDNFLGQGSYNTAFFFSEYPEYVFKVNVGNHNDSLSNDDCATAEVYNFAEECGLEKYFLQCEVLNDFHIQVGLFSDYCEQEYTSSEQLIAVRVSVQKLANETFYSYEQNRIFPYSSRGRQKAYTREKNTLQALRSNEFVSVSTDIEINYTFLRRYGIKEYLRLAHLIKKLGLCDLHDENWGVQENGDLVLIDYAL